jgi:hypothetical protein
MHPQKFTHSCYVNRPIVIDPFHIKRSLKMLEFDRNTHKCPRLWMQSCQGWLFAADGAGFNATSWVSLTYKNRTVHNKNRTVHNKNRTVHNKNRTVHNKIGQCISKTGQCKTKTGQCITKTGQCITKTGQCITKTGQCITKNRTVHNNKRSNSRTSHFEISIITLLFHPCLLLLCDLYPQYFPIKILYPFQIAFMHVTCPANLD